MKTLVCHGDSLTEASDLDDPAIWPSLVEGRLKINDIACLDFYHPFCDDSDAVEEKYFLEDGLHPNKAGHRLMAQKTVELLQSLFNFS